MKRLLVALALAVTVAAAAVPASADPTADVRGAMIAFAKATSYHVSATAEGRDIEADFLPPSRAHFIAAPIEVITIDGTTWVKLGGGWRQFAVPGMDRITGFVQGTIDTMRNPPDDMVVTDLGPKSVDGAALHAYGVTTKSAAGTTTVYIDRSGLLARIDTNDGSTVRFSKFNAPLTIAPPN
jgi:hypothetical protein